MHGVAVEEEIVPDEMKHFLERMVLGKSGILRGGSPKWEDDVPICVPNWEEKK